MDVLICKLIHLLRGMLAMRFERNKDVPKWQERLNKLMNK